MFSMAQQNPEIKAQRDAAELALYAKFGLDPQALNMAMAQGGNQPSMQGFSATEIVE